MRYETECILYTVWVASLLLFVAVELQASEIDAKDGLGIEVSHVALENMDRARDFGEELFRSFEDCPTKVILAGIGAFGENPFLPDEPVRDSAFGDWRYELIALVVILALFILSGIHYLRKRTSREVCPRCHYRSYRHLPIRVLREPTMESSGMAVQEWTCGHCKFTDEETFEISRTNGQLTREGESSHVTYINDVPFDPHYYRDMAFPRELSVDDK